MQELPDFFISRAGADADIAGVIGRILEEAGHRIVLQQWDFANRNFMERMHRALSSRARVIALLSNDYLASQHCEAEWLNAIAHDPLNTKGRLILLRIDECTPKGLLTALAYWDLVPVRGRDDLLADIVRAAIMPDAERRLMGPTRDYWQAPRTVLHPEIKPTAGFTGRDRELTVLGEALWRGETAAVTQPAAVHGLGGVGKSTLAREHAWRERDRYAGVWWLNAERTKDSEGFEGIEKGLVELGAIFIRGLGEAQDRVAAARQTLDFLADGGFAKPWLLVYDNVDDPRALKEWTPRSNAHVLATSRLGGWPQGVTPVEVEEWTMAEAITYLMTASRRPDLREDEAAAIAEALGRLPLALSHAAAYLRETVSATARSYLAALDAHMNAAPASADYPSAVFATFRGQAEEAEARAPGAKAVLSLAAFYAPDKVPEELFQQSPEHYPAPLAAVVADPLRLEQALGTLDRLSLIDFAPESRTFQVHRLVQAAARDALAGEVPAWAASAVSTANAAFPVVEFRNWPICERLLAHARAATGHASDELGAPLASLLSKAGGYLCDRAAYADAEPLYKRDLAISEKAPGQDHRDVGTSLNNLAHLYRAQGKYDLAEPLYQRSLSIIEKALGPDHPDVGISLNNLAGLYDTLGKHNLAEPLYQRSLSIREKALGPGHPDVGTVLNNLAGLYDTLGKYDLAEPLYQRSLLIREKALGPDHPEVGAALNNLAELYRAQGKYDLAEPLYQRSLSIREKSLGPDHPDVGASLNNLALLYLTLGNYDLAEPFYQRSLLIIEKALGPDHPDLGASLNNLAGLYEETGRAAEALLLRRRCLAIVRAKLPGTHPHVRHAQSSLMRLEATLGAGPGPAKLATALQPGSNPAPDALAASARGEEIALRPRSRLGRIALVLLLAVVLLAGLAAIARG